MYIRSRARLTDYRRLAERAAKIWKEHGALDYRENIGDDVYLKGTRSFTDINAAKGNEVILFARVVFESREARDLASEKVAADARMAKLVESIDSGFDAEQSEDVE